MSYHEAYNQPPPATHYNRENSLPSYEEAVANVCHPPATIYEQPTAFSGDFRYNEQPDYQYAQAPRSQVAEISSRIQNVDVRVHVQSASQTNQIAAAEERRRAARRVRRHNKVKKGSVCIAVLVIIGFLIFYYTYFRYSDTKRT